ncbi:hypothetical protein POM88_009719 [Heracleum sosnowskyi]|uniref:HAT C-terminal dimerisation domain-containing protein n=1 Tax=Heracleum sosnowskyi TaxID=360622 RepID=A0AAD8N8N9_9APIA|nr:hypothetical protein POM88_009719 [Heracleum sosnowskyi]
MVVVSPLQTLNGTLSSHHSLPSFKWGSRRDIGGRLIIRRAKNPSFRVLANPNASTGKQNSKEVIMVDPVEAKRLAAKQMEKIKAKEKFKRRRQIEAINGAWAMIGLTAGLVIEGKTGNSIMAQVIGYWTTFISFFVRCNFTNGYHDQTSKFSKGQRIHNSSLCRFQQCISSLKVKVESVLHRLYACYNIGVDGVSTKTINKEKCQRRLLENYMQQQQLETTEKKNDVDIYLAEEPLNPMIAQFDILLWWKDNASRSSLSPKMLEALVCTQSWLKGRHDGIKSDTYLDETYSYEFLEHEEGNPGIMKECAEPSGKTINIDD